MWRNQAIVLRLQRPYQYTPFLSDQEHNFLLNQKPPMCAHKITELGNPKWRLSQDFLCPKGSCRHLPANLPQWQSVPGLSPRPDANHQSCLSVNNADMLVYHPRSPQKYSYKATLVGSAVLALARIRAVQVIFLISDQFQTWGS